VEIVARDDVEYRVDVTLTLTYDGAVASFVMVAIGVVGLL
jgi:hypothetical protein